MDSPEDTWGFRTGERIAGGLRAWTLLGAGWRYETWLAWDEQRRCEVAVKLPLPRQEASDAAAARRRLLSEATTLSSVSHPLIQRFLAGEFDCDPPYLVTQYVEGPPLTSVVEGRRRMQPGDVARLAAQMAGALGYLHSQGLAHLDVKPDNIVCTNGRPVLIDLAYAAPIGLPGPTGGPVGTFAYMAPEQYHLAPTSASMDLFCLGVVLFEAATGRSPFPGAGKCPQLHADALPIRSVLRRFPGPLAEVIDRLLLRDPALRPGSAEETLDLVLAALPRRQDPPWPLSLRAEPALAPA